VLALDDGNVVRDRITDKCHRTVTHPEFGKLSKPQNYIEALSDSLGINPVAFLTARPEQRLELFLQAIPLTIAPEQLADIPAEAMKGVNLKAHALQVLGQIGKNLYDLRTGINRSTTDKAATVRQMSESLPPEAPTGDWAEDLKAATKEFQQLQKVALLHANAIKEDASTARDAARILFHEQKLKVEERSRSQIEDIRLQVDKEIAQADKAAAETIKAIERDKNAALEAAEKEYAPKNADLSQRIGQARALAQQQEGGKKTRQYIATLTAEVKAGEATSAALTAKRESLDEIKKGLLKDLPIAGMEITDGEIFVDGIPFNRVNNSRRIKLAIEIAKLRRGSKGGLIIVDGLEQLDQPTFDAFRKAALAEGQRNHTQFILSRVTAGPLKIETENGGGLIREQPNGTLRPEKIEPESDLF